MSVAIVQVWNCRRASQFLTWMTATKVYDGLKLYTNIAPLYASFYTFPFLSLLKLKYCGDLKPDYCTIHPKLQPKMASLNWTKSPVLDQF